MPDIVHPTPERGTVAGTPKSGQGVCYRFSLSTCSPTFASSRVQSEVLSAVSNKASPRNARSATQL
jgi:hypothetical protein